MAAGTDNADEPVTRRLVIKGVVQGVGYRAAAWARATALGLKGWVRNLPDGSVEVMCQGCRGDVDRLAAWCHLGPAGCDVDSVHYEVIETGRCRMPAGFAITR